MTMNLFTLSSDALPQDAQVVGFRGREALSEPYRFEIAFVTSDPSFVEDDALMARATLAFQLGYASAPYRYHGVLASVELVHAFGAKMLFRAVLVPKLWQLTLSRHSNVWTDTDVPSILKDVLEWSGLAAGEFTLQLDRDYPKREFVAQYKEDNLSFLHRWLERLGMAYYFEQGDEQERLVIVDGPTYDRSGGPGAVKYRPLSEGDSMALEAFEFVRQRTHVLPGTVELQDYDYLKPNLEVRANARVPRTKVGVVNRFADDHFATPVEGQELARFRAEALQAQHKVLHARGRVFHLHAGRLFALEDHPRAELNRKYLVTSIVHEANQAADLPEVKEALGIDLDKEYSCELTAIPSQLTYRTPADRTPWPRIASYEAAVVCGEADSPYAQIDEHGRYKVRVMFDESDLGDGKASAWVRQQQPYGGSTEGFHFPLLKGTEVTLIFLGGDPDRPVIAGVVPNSQTPSPVVAKNHTQNVIQTVNQNLVKLEDKLGEQSVYVYCPIESSYLHLGVLKEGFNLVLSSAGHGHFNFGGHQVIDVAASLTENVQADVTSNYFANYAVNVLADNAIEIQGSKTLHVAGDVQYDFDALWKTTVLGDKVSDVSGIEEHHVVGDSSSTYDANVNVDIAGDHIVHVSGNQNQVVTNNLNVTVNNAVTHVHQGPTINTYNNSYHFQVAGPVDESFWSFSAKLNGGATSETFLGVKNSNHIGAKIETFVGLDMQLKLAVAIEASLSFKLNLTPSLNFGVTGGKIDTIVSKIEAIAGPRMLNAGIRLENAGLTVVL